MVKLIRGRYSSNLLGPGTELSLSPEEEERLVRRKIAVKIDKPSNDSEDEEKSSESFDYKTEDELKKMKTKKEIVEYAQSLGLELDESEKKEVLVNAVLNYIEEHLDMQDSDEF